jgi:hypothetical protein
MSRAEKIEAAHLIALLDRIGWKPLAWNHLPILPPMEQDLLSRRKAFFIAK